MPETPLPSAVLLLRFRLAALAFIVMALRRTDAPGDEDVLSGTDLGAETDRSGRSCG